MCKSFCMLSPLNVSMKEGILSLIEQVKVDRKTWLNIWVELMLWNPASSFEDYKDLKQHSVLKHMTPLRSLLTQKVKLRVKVKPSKRVLQVKNDHSTAAKKRARTFETILIAIIQPSQSCKVKGKPLKPLSSCETEENNNYTPKGLTKVSTTQLVFVKDTQAQSSLHSTSNSHTLVRWVRLKTVMSSAVAHSYEISNSVLELVIKKLFDESLENHTLTDLLDTVLS